MLPFSSSFIDVASALCADSFGPQARRYNFGGGAGTELLNYRRSRREEALVFRNETRHLVSDKERNI
jgi:hypothetical protein